jgi:hypothetical protein
MDIKKVLLKEHTSRNALKIVNYIGDNPARFNLLVQVLLEGPYKVSQRASWPLSICIEHHPELIKPHLGTILKILDNRTVHDAVRRNIVRLLQFIEIPRRYYGKVWSSCYQLMDPKQPIAVRVFSMTVLATIAAKEPDLKNELLLLIEDQLPYASAGYLARAKKVLKELRRDK